MTKDRCIRPKQTEIAKVTLQKKNARNIVTRFLQLPHHRRVHILQTLNVYTEGLPERELHNTAFDTLRQTNRVEEFVALVEKEPTRD